MERKTIKAYSKICIAYFMHGTDSQAYRNIASVELDLIKAIKGTKGKAKALPADADGNKIKVHALRDDVVALIARICEQARSAAKKEFFRGLMVGLPEEESKTADQILGKALMQDFMVNFFRGQQGQGDAEILGAAAIRMIVLFARDEASRLEFKDASMKRSSALRLLCVHFPQEQKKLRQLNETLQKKEEEAREAIKKSREGQSEEILLPDDEPEAVLPPKPAKKTGKQPVVPKQRQPAPVKAYSYDDQADDQLDDQLDDAF